MTNKHECSISSALYWVSIFLEYGYSIAETQKELADQLGIRVQLSEDKDFINVQLEGAKNIWSIEKHRLHEVQQGVFESIVRNLVSGTPIKLFDEE